MMRDRLAELIADARSEYYYYSNESHEKGKAVTESSEEYIADHLIANGVVVPPCKVGDKMYYDVKLFASHSKGQIMESTVTFINTEVCSTFRGEVNITFDFDCFGKTVFLNREDAERALKGEKE